MKYSFGISPRGVFEATQLAHRYTSDRHCFWSKTILCLLLNSCPHWSYYLLVSYSLTVFQHECHLPYGTPWAPLSSPHLSCPAILAAYGHMLSVLTVTGILTSTEVLQKARALLAASRGLFHQLWRTMCVMISVIQLQTGRARLWKVQEPMQE